MRISHTPLNDPELFSSKSGASSSFAKHSQHPSETVGTLQTRYVLPRNLRQTIKRIDNVELDRLLGVVLAETTRRGRPPPSSLKMADKKQRQVAPVPLTTTKLNAIRAAFEAGVRPSQIAREFGLPQGDVRNARKKTTR
jgi:hypothetical protein